MKKTLIALALVASASLAMALDVGVATVYDYSMNDSGARIVVSTAPVGAFAPQVSVTQFGNTYTRYAAGGKYAFATIGPVAFAATGAGVYQNTGEGRDGFGLTVGLVASVPLYKNVTLDASVERFVGQSAVSNRDGNVAGVGLTARF